MGVQHGPEYALGSVFALPHVSVYLGGSIGNVLLLCVLPPHWQLVRSFYSKYFHDRNVDK
jgi:hypothetical protein